MTRSDAAFGGLFSTAIVFAACGGSNSSSSGVHTDGGSGGASSTSGGTSSTSGSGTSSGTTSSGGSSGGSSGAGSSSSGGVAAASALHAVMGSGGKPGHLEDANGKTVILHGVNESGSENFCQSWGPPAVVFSPTSGPSPMTQASLTAMKSWGINAVRIPLNEACWLGINGVATNVGGANYQSAIAQAVDLITNKNGMYVILDLHVVAPASSSIGSSTPPFMADVKNSVPFWKQIATQYKGNGAVIFDLLNEPNLGNWSSTSTPQTQFQCWKNGSTAANSGDCPTVPWAVAGMQTLVNTVRQAGANNLVILGGMGDASVMAPWPSYVPTDTLTPPNIAASWHAYDIQGGCTTDHNGSLAILCPSSNMGEMGNGIESVMQAGYPVIVGETGYGAGSCSSATGSAWWPFFLSWATAQEIGTFAWAWSVSSGPQLLSDATNFTPNANGTVYKTFLSCIASKTVTPLASCTALPSTGCE